LVSLFDLSFTHGNESNGDLSRYGSPYPQIPEAAATHGERDTRYIREICGAIHRDHERRAITMVSCPLER
jgi:hypothetical protein